MDLHRVFEYPERLSKRLLQQTKSQEGIHISPSEGEGK
jgi:hypothetical protein